MSPDEPTDEMPGGSEEPTVVNPPGDEPTEVTAPGNEPTGTISGGTEGSRGIGVLVASIVAALLLVGIYIAAGGLDNGPDKAANPCDARPWTDPQNVEEAAQQFALSAADGAACDLGVSREELTRSIADEQARQEFMEEHGFSETDLEDALRAGLNRATDDAENAGALSPLAAIGIRAAIRVMPMSVMIDLLENADGVFSGDLGALGGIGDAIDAITDGVNGLESGDGDNSLEGLGGVIEDALPEGTTDALEGQIPDDLQQQLEDEAMQRLEQGLDGLLNP